MLTTVLSLRHNTTRLQQRQGFTLIELLVVVGIIAVLAGLLLPVVGLVRRMANDIKCGNNLQQIGAAIEVYKNENDDSFPPRLRWKEGELDPLTPGELGYGDLFRRNGPLQGLGKILRCPSDAQNGTDQLMGRPSSSWEDLSAIYTEGSSYMFEVSSVPLNGGQLDFFFKDRLKSGETLPTLGTRDATWVAGKHNQIRFGNLDEYKNIGASFPQSQFPILRCYWHYKWTGSDRNFDKESSTRKVKNVSWELNVFDSTPYWEHDANPNIPIK